MIILWKCQLFDIKASKNVNKVDSKLFQFNFSSFFLLCLISPFIQGFYVFGSLFYS